MMTSNHMVIILVIASILLVFSYQANADPVRCDQCTKDYPCATLFEFKNVKFMHNVYCEVVDGQEVWGSEDEEKYDVFYFERPDKSRSKKQLDI